MSNKLWEKKGWKKLNSQLQKFESGALYQHPDNKLALADVFGSLAHAKMLSTIGILSSSEFKEIKIGLSKIYELALEGKFLLEEGDEDIHTKIENFLTEKYGTVGKKIHTGRSRNDQVLLDIRLYGKEELISIAILTLKLAKVILSFAKKHEYLPVVGYTHMQKAMPSSIGLWAASFVESLLDDLKLIDVAYELNDQSPLGSVASYGVSIPINREYTAEILGFAKVQNNVLYCQNSRGKIEAAAIFAFCEIAETLSKMAEDILLFNMPEFGYLSVAGNVVTGSSIMPQKKNLDVMELVRAKAHLLYGQLTQTLTMISGLPSGYNKDSKETKKLLVHSVDLIKSLLTPTNLVWKELKVNEEKCLNSLTSDVYATDYANEMTITKNVPFREAYKLVGENLSSIPVFDPVDNIKMKKHLGATGNLGLGKIAKEIKQKELFWENKEQAHHQNLKKLWKL